MKSCRVECDRSLEMFAVIGDMVDVHFHGEDHGSLLF